MGYGDAVMSITYIVAAVPFDQLHRWHHVPRQSRLCNVKPTLAWEFPNWAEATIKGRCTFFRAANTFDRDRLQPQIVLLMTLRLTSSSTPDVRATLLLRKVG